VVFLDTAGIRDADSAAEREGVRRAMRAGADCDLALWLDDLSEAPSAPQVQGATAVLAIGTKADLANGALRLIPAVSAVTGHGIDALLGLIQERAAAGAADSGIVVRERQHVALAAAVQMLRQVGGSDQEEIVAELLRSAGDAIGSVSGQVGAEQVLDRIFSEFCIGK